MSEAREATAKEAAAAGREAFRQGLPEWPLPRDFVPGSLAAEAFRIGWRIEKAFSESVSPCTG